MSKNEFFLTTKLCGIRFRLCCQHKEYRAIRGLQVVNIRLLTVERQVSFRR